MFQKRKFQMTLAVMYSRILGTVFILKSFMHPIPRENTLQSYEKLRERQRKEGEKLCGNVKKL